MNSTTTTSTAEALAREWAALGFVEGAPRHIPAAIIAADKRIYRRLRCPSCEHRGMIVTPMSRGQDYRLLLACPSCGAGDEG